MNFTFKTNAIVIISGQRFRILRILVDGRIQLEAEDDGTISNTNRDELLKKYAEKELTFDVGNNAGNETPQRLGRSLSSFPESTQQSAIRKKQYLDFLLNLRPFTSTAKILTPLIAECAKKIGDKNPPSVISVYRWHRALVRNSHDHRSLISRHDRKGGCGSRLHPDVTRILQDVIDEIYLSEQRNSGDDVFYAVVHQINKKNEFLSEEEKLSVPSRATVYRAIASLDKYDETSARFGKRIAQMKFRTSGLGARPMRILE